MIGCPRWPPTSSAARWPSLSREGVMRLLPLQGGDFQHTHRSADTHHQCRVAEVKRTLCKHSDNRRY
jgi:hypothetical protein